MSPPRRMQGLVDRALREQPRAEPLNSMRPDHDSGVETTTLMRSFPTGVEFLRPAGNNLLR